MIKNRLFTPGPVSVYPPALAAALEANIHHRTPEFKEILWDVMGSLKRVLGEPDHLFLFAASGSGAMEAAVSNFFSPGEEVAVASCGKFGERWIELTQRFGLTTHILKSVYGDPARSEEIAALLRKNPDIKGVFIQACESSTGVQNDVEQIAKAMGNSEALLIVDAVSALATMPLSTRLGIDVLLSGSQKALMIPPGLSFLGLTENAWKRVESSKLPRYYFDLRSARKSWDQGGQTPFTPATSLILSLQKSLKAIEQVGLERLIQLTENRARATRAGLCALSLNLFSKAPANALTAVKFEDADKVTSALKKRFGIHLAGGQGDMKGKVFRISHMGYMDHFDLLGVLSALEFVLKENGHPVTLGSSLQAFQQVYSEVA
ncbi:alanine--glyoxylate aminotransferase family protein [bacterium]|nr:alanine--glyoxylate aminotransferase family protein [bacterium]